MGHMFGNYSISTPSFDALLKNKKARARVKLAGMVSAAAMAACAPQSIDAAQRKITAKVQSVSIASGPQYSMTYTVHDIGSLGAFPVTPYKINSSGRIVGTSETPSGTYHAFMTGPHGSGMVDLGDFGGGGQSIATGINSNGEVVGYFDYPGSRHGFVTGPNGVGYTDITASWGLEYLMPYGINDNDLIAGSGYYTSSLVNPDGNSGFFGYANGKGVTEINLGAGTSQSYASRVNNAGQVLGYVTASATDPFLRNPDGSSTIYTTLAVENFNDNGQLVGHDLNIHAFITGPNGVGQTDLGVLPGETQSDGRGVNSSGQVVGVSGFRAFVTGPNGTGMADLNVLAPGYNFTIALDINDAGEIVVEDLNSNHAYILIPATASVAPTVDPDATEPADKNPTCDCNSDTVAASREGMTKWSVQRTALSLQLHDNPVSYKPPVGEAINIDVFYSHRDAQLPTAGFNFSNFGPKWATTWMSYVTNNGATAKLFERGGGAETYTFNGSTQSQIGPYTQGQMTEVLSGSTVVGYTRQLKDGTVEQFMHAAGSQFFMTATIDPQGNKTTINYDSSNRITTIVDAIGQSTTFSYGLSGDPLKITQVTDPFGRAAKFGYTGGQLTSITDTIGIQSQFHWKDSAFIDTLTTPYGTTSFAFTDNTTDSTLGTTRTLTVTDPMNRTSRYEYNDNAPGVTASDASVPSGMSVSNKALNTNNTYIWDAQEYALATAGGGLDYTKATTIHWALTADGTSVSRVPLSVKPPLESRIWYNYSGQADATKAGATNTPTATGRVLDDGSTQISTATYNAAGNPLVTTDPVGRQIQYGYDTNNIDVTSITNITGGGNQAIMSAQFNSQHEPLTVTGADGQTTTIGYNSYGEKASVTDPKGNITQYGYSGAYLTSITAANGYNVTIAPDTVGRIGTLTNADGTQITFGYDDADRIKIETFLDGTSIKNGYTLLDLTSTTDRLGKTTTYDHNNDRELTAVQDPLGHTVQYGRSPTGALSSITDANNNTTSFGLDAESRPTSKTYADGSIWQTAYEATTSRVHSITDAIGQSKIFGWTPDDKVSSISYAGSVHATPNVAFTYDPVFPRMASMTDGNGTTTFGFNPQSGLGAGQLNTVTSPVPGSTSLTDIIKHGYEERGYVNSLTANDFAETRVFDALSRIGTVTNPLSTFTYGYSDGTSRVATIASNNVQVTNGYYTPTQDGLLQQSTFTSARGTLAQFGYGYNANDNVTSFSSAYAGQALPTITAAANGTISGMTGGTTIADAGLSGSKLSGSSHDAVLALGAAAGAGFLMFGMASMNGAAGTRRRKVALPLAAASMLVASCGGGGGGSDGGDTGGGSTGTPIPTVTPSLINYGYDDASRLLTGTVKTGSTVTPQYSFGYDPASNVLSLTNGSTTQTLTVNNVNQLTSNAATYDANGNIKSMDGKTYDWDADNRLIGFTSGTLSSTFGYDGLGRLNHIVDMNNGKATSNKTYVWDGDTLAQERDNLAGGAITKQYYAQGVVDHGANYHYVRDQLGNIRQLVDASGAVAAQYDYTPYGERSYVGGSAKSDIGYAGYFHHEQSGLDFTRHRAYDAGHARWLNRDPIGEAGSSAANLYGYVNGNPTTMRDPMGTDATSSFSDWYLNNPVLQYVGDHPQYGEDMMMVGGMLAAGGIGALAQDICEVSAGRYFGTRYLGNIPRYNSGDDLRIGWSKLGDEYTFRIGGDWVKEIKPADPHITLWPPKYWGGVPKP